MSETTKTVLIAGGVVVGAYVLMRVLSPPAATVPRPSAGTSSLAGIIGAVANIGSSVTNLFGHSSGGASNPNAPTVPANFDTSNYSVSNGFMFTDASGNFVAG
jgi:hypothetical protein